MLKTGWCQKKIAVDVFKISPKLPFYFGINQYFGIPLHFSPQAEPFFTTLSPLFTQ